MTPDMRREWLTFAFILWFVLGAASGKWALMLVGCVAGFVASLPTMWPRAQHDTAVPVTPTRHDDDPEGPVLDV